jgi:4'-phosphopantetheinyl transferase
VSVPLVVLAAAAELPPGDGWLRPAERAILRRFRAPRRRRDFRLGRLAAKRALGLLTRCEGRSVLNAFEVRPGPGGAPLAFRDGAPLAAAVSISHSDGWASATVRLGKGPLGCDLERVETRSRSFQEDYFTPREQAFVADAPESERALLATLLWGAKEAVMKALGQGLRLPPAAVEVRPAMDAVSASGWRRFSISAPPGATALRGFWRVAGGAVLTVAGAAGEPRLVAPGWS